MPPLPLLILAVRLGPVRVIYLYIGEFGTNLAAFSNIEVFPVPGSPIRRALSQSLLEIHCPILKAGIYTDHQKTSLNIIQVYLPLNIP